MQGGASGDLFSALLPWLGGLLAVAFIGAMLMALTRRMAVGKSTNDSQGFTLDALHDLRKRGEISAEEFELARRMMIDRLRDSAFKSKIKKLRPTDKSH